MPEGVGRPELVECAEAVGEDRDARPDRLDGRRALDHGDVVAVASECGGGGESADSGADHDRMH